MELQIVNFGFLSGSSFFSFVLSFVLTGFFVFPLISFKCEKLSRNPIGNRAISVLSGQRPYTRINLSILQSFLHFLKAKDVSSCLD